MEKSDKMTTLDAVNLVEGFVDLENNEQLIEAWQYLIDTGIAWKLQGWYGRTALNLIEDKVCASSKYCPTQPPLI
jgi:hypothetical protein